MSAFVSLALAAVVLPPNPTAVERTAAAELEAALGRIAGGTLKKQAEEN